MLNDTRTEDSEDPDPVGGRARSQSMSRHLWVGNRCGACPAPLHATATRSFSDFSSTQPRTALRARCVRVYTSRREINHALGAAMRAPHSLPLPNPNLPFSVTTSGAPALADSLASALRAQWGFGFPIVPKPLQQLTHGFLQYPAGLQPVAAVHMLKVLPTGVLLDPFVGGGTTLVEALRSGRTPIGADASPLALFTASHHTWIASDEHIEQLRADATDLLTRCDPEIFAPASRDESDGAAADPTASATTASAEGRSRRPSPYRGLERDGGAGKTTLKMWEPLKQQLELSLADGSADGGADGDGAPARSPLWFCFAAAQQRSQRYRFSSPLASFDATVDDYCDALRELREAVPAAPASPQLLLRSTSRGSAPPLLLRDARSLRLAEEGLPLADAILTSPPCARHARAQRRRHRTEAPHPRHQARTSTQRAALTSAQRAALWLCRAGASGWLACFRLAGLLPDGWPVSGWLACFRMPGRRAAHCTNTHSTITHPRTTIAAVMHTRRCRGLRLPLPRS